MGGLRGEIREIRLEEYAQESGEKEKRRKRERERNGEAVPTRKCRMPSINRVFLSVVKLFPEESVRVTREGRTSILHNNKIIFVILFLKGNLLILLLWDSLA